MRTILATACSLAMLSACAQDPGQPVDSDVTAYREGADEQSLANETETGPTRAADGAADVGITDPDLAQGRIPVRFLGVWDYFGGTCNPASDLRLEIKPRRITFYESVGDVAGVGQDGDAAVADLVMEGEGEEWIQSTRLQLSENGERLLVTDATKPDLTDDYPRKRCPEG